MQLEVIKNSFAASTRGRFDLGLVLELRVTGPICRRVGRKPLIFTGGICMTTDIIRWFYLLITIRTCCGMILKRYDC